MNKHALVEKLKKRFYYLSEQGGQRLYWDSVTNQQLRTMHLLQQLIDSAETSEQKNEIGAKWKEYAKAISDSFFPPIVLTPLYRPEQAPVVTFHHNHHPNSWRPPRAKPNKKLSAKPFVEHLRLMLGSKAKADYLLDMLAYRYQKPDFTQHPKPHVAFYFFGEPGMGKGTFSTVIKNVFGETAVRVAPDQAELKSMSGVDLWTRTWLFVEEVDVKKGSTDYNKLKTFIGGNSFDSARKNEHFKRHETPAQLIMFSNSAPNFIEPNDRRFFISKWEHAFSDTQEKTDYFEEYHNWLDGEEAYPAIAALLKHRKIDHVQVAAPAAMTEEKAAVTTLMRDPSVEDIKFILEEKPSRVCFSEEDFQKIWEKHEVPKKARKYKLSDAGLTKTPKKRYYEKRKSGQRKSNTLELWLRPGWKLEAQNGVEPMLRGQEESRKLRHDSGYQNLFSSWSDDIDWEFEDF